MASDAGLCGACWREVVFIRGCTCTACGTPLPGPEEPDVLCDACLLSPRPWQRGAAAILHEGRGRALVLGLKRHDRHDLFPVAARWMAQAAPDLCARAELVVPVPMHRLRLLRRRYNPAADLARALAAHAGLPWEPAALKRIRATPPQEGLDRPARLANMEGAIGPHPRRGRRLAGRRVLLIDDVLTTGATLAACTRAALAAGARGVDVLALARVAEAP